MPYELPDGESLNQRVSMEWETPTHDEIVEISKMHVAILESAESDQGWVMAGMHHVLLFTLGRRTRNLHRVALPFWRDPDGVRVVIGSFAGARSDPAWILNLLDREVNPGVKVKTQHGTYWAIHEFLIGEERDDLWSRMTADRAFYGDYQDTTERKLPMVRLPENEVIES